MLRSRDVVVAELLERHPQWRVLFRRGRTRLLRFMLRRSWRNRDLKAVAAMGARMVGGDPVGGISNIVDLLLARLRRKSASECGLALGDRFPIGDPAS